MLNQQTVGWKLVNHLFKGRWDVFRPEFLFSRFPTVTLDAERFESSDGHE